MRLTYDSSLDALIKPGSDQHYFQFDKIPPVYLSSKQFEITSACLLIELCRLIYRSDQLVYCGDEKISFLQTVLNRINIEWIDCFKNDSASVYSWLLKTSAYDMEMKKPRDCLLLIFRGSSGLENWKLNANATQVNHQSMGNIHTGFYEAFQQIEEQLNRSDDLKKYPVIISGHSLGAALASLTKSSLEKEISIDSCYTFGSPKVGDSTFVNSIEQSNIYRVINHNDLVTMLPFDFFNIEYKHVGQSHYFTNEKHYVDYLDHDIKKMQQQDLPRLKHINKFDGFLTMIKGIEKDIPLYLSDHAPINYLVRLNQQLSGLIT